MKINTLAIVGVGLIGGSIGLAAKKRGIADSVWGVGRKGENIIAASERGIIDHYHDDLGVVAQQADVIVFCLPVDQIAEQVLAAAQRCQPGTLLIDSGSTKSLITRSVEECLPARAKFVGCHPLAGSEKSGPEHANANLFDGKLTVLTPTDRTDPQTLERASQFWRALGARVYVMSPEDHDRVLALTSHLPHLVAAALAGLLPEEARGLTASGFRDATRVASGDSSIWTPILWQNREAVLACLEQFSNRLSEFRRTLAAGDKTTLDELLTTAKKVRDALGS